MSVPPPSHCPNCGTAWPPEAPVCPHCGWVRPAPDPNAVWPPPVAGYSPLAPPVEPKPVTGKVWGDVTLGFGLCLLTYALFLVGAGFGLGLGFFGMPVAYFLLRRRYPPLMRGFGYGLLLGAALLLGAIVYCFANLSNYNKL